MCFANVSNWISNRRKAFDQRKVTIECAATVNQVVTADRRRLFYLLRWKFNNLRYIGRGANCRRLLLSQSRMFGQFPTRLHARCPCPCLNDCTQLQTVLSATTTAKFKCSIFWNWQSMFFGNRTVTMLQLLVMKGTETRGQTLIIPDGKRFCYR